jgi:hypothetical protein
MSRERAVGAVLERVAAQVEFPETPPLASAVRRRIERGPLPVGAIRLPRTKPALWRPVMAGTFVLALLLAVTLSVSVTARRAVADFLGVVGIRITFGDEPRVTPSPEAELELGRRVDVAAASRRAGFDVLVPADPSIEGLRPAVYYDPAIGESGMVSLVYPADATTASEARLLVTQFVGSVDDAFFKKLAVPGGEVSAVPVGSEAGYWISGEPHLIYYMDETFDTREETVRLAGNVLLWDRDGVTYRVEGARSRGEALRIAQSLR